MCGEGPEEDGACPALVALTVEGETTSPPASRAPHRPKVLHPGKIQKIVIIPHGRSQNREQNRQDTVQACVKQCARRSQLTPKY